MIKVGLTGGIATGKSTVRRMLEDEGIPVICADELAREAVKQGSSGLGAIRDEFGARMIDETGNLDRAAMAAVVFADLEARNRLEEIIHPVVAKLTKDRLTELCRQGRRVAVVDVPLLYEKKWTEMFDIIVLVYATPEVQRKRLRDRDDLNDAEISARIESQMPIEKKKELADIVIDNSGDIENTRAQAQKAISSLGNMNRETGVKTG
jgi:dephospho-CoA kinase